MNDSAHVPNRQPDYSRAMKLFEDAKSKGYEKEAKAVMDSIAAKYPKDASAPPDEIEHGLEGILAKHSHATPTSTDYLMRLAATLAGIAFLGMYL